MLRPGFPRLSHPEVAHAIPSVGFMAQVYRRVRLLVSPTIVGVQLTDQQRTAQAPDFRRCTDSEVYPLNLMVFTGLPADGWETAWYGSLEEIADPGKALARWLRQDRPPGASSAEADPIEV